MRGILGADERRRWGRASAGGGAPAEQCARPRPPGRPSGTGPGRPYTAAVPPAFLARNLEKRYGTVQALRGVDVEIGEGELIGLLGPNGAGKSTLVKIACGLVRASGGRAEVCGAPAGSPAARASLGYLAELFRFPGWYSADELLALHQRLTRSTGGAAERLDLLRLVGLDHARTVRVEAMSKGM